MDDERRRILEMVQQQRLSPQEAEALLSELDASTAGARQSPRWEQRPGQPEGCVSWHGRGAGWVGAMAAGDAERAVRRALRRVRWRLRYW